MIRAEAAALRAALLLLAWIGLTVTLLVQAVPSTAGLAAIPVRAVTLGELPLPSPWPAAPPGPPPWPTAAPTGIDPARLLYTGLYRLDADGDLRPAAATSWQSSASGRRHRFALRSGVRFADGSPLGAGDVLASWQLLLRQRPDLAAEVRSVAAVDDEAVELHLRGPAPAVVREFALQALIPANWLQSAADQPGAGRGGPGTGTEGLPAPPGTGPYRWAGAEHGRWLLERHAYWAEAAHGGISAALPGRLEWAAASTEALPELFDRDLALISGVPPAEARRYAARARAAGFHQEELNGGWVAALIVNALRPPLDATPVRLALAAAWDHQQLASSLGAAAPVAAPGKGQAAAGLEQALAAAGYVRTDAGWQAPGGAPLQLRLLAPAAGLWQGFGGEESDALARELGRQLAAMGLATDLRLAEPHEFLAELYVFRDFDLAVVPVPIDAHGELQGLESLLELPGLPPLPAGPTRPGSLVPLVAPVQIVWHRLDGTGLAVGSAGLSWETSTAAFPSTLGRKCYSRPRSCLTPKSVAETRGDGVAERLLEVRNLKTYFRTSEGTVPAVDGVSFHIDRGETLGIVGESGCGKSVTSLSIMRLIPKPPGEIVGGEILFNGEDLLRKSEAAMRRIRGNEISMIFQEPMTSLNPVYTVGDQIAEAIRLHQGLDARRALVKATEMLALVGIPSPEQRVRAYPHQLSGGMRQRVMIAMALSCNPKLLIADEPTTALDVTIQAQILELMKDLRRRIGTSILLITHDLGVVAEMCDRVVVMYAGKIVEEADVYALFRQPYHPYTEGLLESIPKLTQPRGSKLHVIEGTVPNPLDMPTGCRFHPRCPYASDRCRAEEPPLEQVADGRQVACWHWERLAAKAKGVA